MKKGIAVLFTLLLFASLVSFLLINFIKVGQARSSEGCCQKYNSCYDTVIGFCFEGGAFKSGRQCCDDGVCRYSCATTTTSTTTTIPDGGGGKKQHGEECTRSSECADNLWCSPGGCGGVSLCCVQDKEYAYCYDPPGGVAESRCKVPGGDSPTCHYCEDLAGEHYNVGECVTSGSCPSGWAICTDNCDESAGVYEWACESSPEQNCPNFGSGGSGGGGGSGSTTTTTTTIPYDVLDATFKNYHDGEKAVFPAFGVLCDVERQGDKYVSYYWTAVDTPAGSSSGGGVSEKPCQFAGWAGNTAVFNCETSPEGKPTLIECKWTGDQSKCNSCSKSKEVSLNRPALSLSVQNPVAKTAEPIHLSFSATSPFYLDSWMLVVDGRKTDPEKAGQKVLSFSLQKDIQLPDGRHEVRLWVNDTARRAGPSKTTRPCAQPKGRDLMADAIAKAPGYARGRAVTSSCASCDAARGVRRCRRGLPRPAGPRGDGAAPG